MGGVNGWGRKAQPVYHPIDLINEDDRLNSETSIYALDKLERDIREHGDPYSMTDIV